jgi:hypothetical protein
MCGAALRRGLQIVIASTVMMFSAPGDSPAQVTLEAVAPAEAHHIVLAGRIDVHTLYSFVRLIADYRISETRRPVVKLDSIGGSVTAAMAIGHLVRDRGFTTVVEPGKECLSACVLILAAGTERVISSASSARVGVHRPRHGVAVAAPSTIAQIRANDQLIEDMRRYLDAMGMGERLFAAIIAEPPDSMKVLSRDEMRAFGLLAGDVRTAAAAPRRVAVVPAPEDAGAVTVGLRHQFETRLKNSKARQPVVAGGVRPSKRRVREVRLGPRTGRTTKRGPRHIGARQGLTLMHSVVLGTPPRTARHGIDLANWRVQPNH